MPSHNYSIKFAYITALLIIAALAFASYFFLRRYTSVQTNAAQIIEISGQQRTYSQRIALSAEQMADSETGQAINRNNLLTQVVQMERDHNWLLANDQNFIMSMPDKLDEFYTTTLNHQLEDYWAAARRLAASKPSTWNKNSPNLQYIVASAPGLLLLLDDVVHQYVSANLEELQNLERLELIVLVVMLLALLMEAVFIFHPLDVRLFQNASALLAEIAERKEAEEAARRGEKLYRLLVQHLPDLAVQLYDRDFRYTLAEGKFLEKAGYSKQGLEGKTLFEVVPPEAAQFLRPYYQQVLDGEQVTFEATRDAFTYVTTIVPVRNEKGEISGGMVVSQDVTEQRKLEDERTQMAVEKVSVEQIAEVLRSTAHDLRTPLAIIQTSVYLIERIADPESQKGRIEVIKKQVTHMTQLIDQLQLMANLDRTQHLDLQSVDVSRLLADVKRKFETRSQEKHLHLSLNAPSALIMKIDEEQISKALSYLLDNAITFTPTGGSITLNALQHEREVVIEVSDTGIGIAPEDVHHIFKRFYKADKARTSGVGGAGLGLTMAKKIVQMHHGEIQVESTLGTGSTFRILLPVVAEPI
jgi:PAS domain S-box-containing protein